MATRTPAPATTNAATVEMLNVDTAAAARAAGIEQRFGITQACVDSSGLLAHGPRETQQFVGSLAFDAQAHQKRGNLRRGGLAAQNDEHGVARFGGRQIFAGGDFVQEGQKHGKALDSRYHEHKELIR